MRDYIACIDAVDENIGRILDYLDQNNLSKNTIVVYSSDQSYFIGEHGWAEKRWMYEESLRMPLVMRWPQAIPKGTVIESMVQNIDHAPTLLDICGIKTPSEMQGHSMLPLFKGQTKDWRQSIYYHYYHHGAHNVPRHDGIRTERYKLIHFYTDDVYELYNLKKDPNELSNLSSSPEHLSIKKDLQKQLQGLREEAKVPEKHFQAPYLYPITKKKKSKS